MLFYKNFICYEIDFIVLTKYTKLLVDTIRFANIFTPLI